MRKQWTFRAGTPKNVPVFRWLGRLVASGGDAFVSVQVVAMTNEVMHATLTGMAEGLVDGQRVSVPLTIERLPNIQGRWVVRWIRPDSGKWVLAFSVGTNPEICTVIAVQPDGVKPQLLLLKYGLSWKRGLVEEALGASRGG